MLKKNQPSGSTREPTIALRVYDTISLNPEKYGWVDVLSSLPITDVKQLSDERTRTSAGSTAIQGISEKRSAMVYWSQKGGLVTMKHANEHIPGTIVYAFRAGEKRSGFFYHKDGKHPLGLVVLDHESNPSHVKSKPGKYDGELMGVLQDVYPPELARCKNKEETTFFTVQFACLRDTDVGPLLAVLITVPSGDTAYCVTAALDHPASWQRWSFSASKVPITQCFIAPDGKSVHLLTVAVRPPRRIAGVLVEKSIPEAFSKMERVPVDVDDVPRVVSNDAESTTLGCLVVEETVVPVHSSKQVVTHRFYESASALMTREQWEYVHTHSPILRVEESCLLLTVLVPMMNNTFIVHLTFSNRPSNENSGASGGGSGMQSHCEILVGLENPADLSTLEGLAVPNRTSRTSISLVLSKDLKIYACEVFGSVIRINLEGASSIPIFVPQREGKKKQKVGVTELTKTGKEELVRLLQMPNGEVLFSNGAISHFLCVTYAYLSPSVPPRQLQYPPLTLLDGSSNENDASSYEDRLRGAMMGIQEMISQNTNHEVIPEIFAARILPGLRFIGSAAMEMQLIQAVYRRVLEVALPNTEEDWLRLWELTRFIQRVIARRNREVAVHYMDHFFLQLAKVYHESSFASPEGILALKEGLLNVVSDELRQSILSPPPSAGVEYFFTAISNGTPYLSLALDLTRRLASVSVTDKGQCIGHTTPEGAPILHAMGFVLLGSCVDVPLFLVPDGDSKQRIRCDVSPPLDASFSLSVPVQPFNDQQDFNKALALAADLLSIAPATSYSEVEAAIFTIFISHRYQCASTLFDLLDPVLTDALKRAAPLHNNREWFEECAFAASVGCDDELKRIITRADGKHPIIPSLCFALQQNGILNVPLYRVLEKRLTSEASTACMIILVFSLTESMVAAQNNYASASMKYLQCSQPLEIETEAAHMAMLEDRLRAVVKKNRQLWAWIHVLLPYKARDLAQSYIASLSMSLSGGNTTEPVGTMLSRTLVMCFRLFVFVSFSMEALDYLDQARRQFIKEGSSSGAEVSEHEDNKTASHTPEERCLSGLRYLFLADAAVIPKEWYQIKLLQLLRTAYVSHAVNTLGSTVSSPFHWASFLLQILNLTDISVHCNVASVKKEFFDLTDELRGRVRATASTGTVGVTDGQSTEMSESMRKYCRIAEEIANNHHRLLSSTERREKEGEGASDFIFSQRRDSTLPRWTFPHDRRERRYLIDTDWIHHLWALERDATLITSVALAVADQLVFESNELASQEKKRLEEEQNGVRHTNAPELSRLLFSSIHDELLPDNSFAAEVMHQMKVKNTVQQDIVEPPSISHQIAASQQVLAEQERVTMMRSAQGAREDGSVNAPTKSLEEMAKEVAVAGLPPLMAPVSATHSDSMDKTTTAPVGVPAGSKSSPALTLSLPPPTVDSMTASPPSVPLGNSNLIHSFIPAGVSPTPTPSSSVSPPPVAGAQTPRQENQEGKVEDGERSSPSAGAAGSASQTPVKTPRAGVDSGSGAATDGEGIRTETPATASGSQNGSLSASATSHENVVKSDEKRHSAEHTSEKVSSSPAEMGSKSPALFSGTAAGGATVNECTDKTARRTPFSMDAVAWWENPSSYRLDHEVRRMIPGAKSSAHRRMPDGGSSDTSYETATTYTVGGTSYTPTPTATPEWREMWRDQIQHQRTAGKGKNYSPSSASAGLSPHHAPGLPNRHRDVMSWNSDHLKPSCKRANANHGSTATRGAQRGRKGMAQSNGYIIDDQYIDAYEENTALRQYLRHLSKEARCSSEPPPFVRTEVRHYHRYPEDEIWDGRRREEGWSSGHTGVRCCHCRRNCATHRRRDEPPGRSCCADECDYEFSDYDVAPSKRSRDIRRPARQEGGRRSHNTKRDQKSRGRNRAVESGTEEESVRHFYKKKRVKAIGEGSEYGSSSTSTGHEDGNVVKSRPQHHSSHSDCDRRRASSFPIRSSVDYHDMDPYAPPTAAVAAVASAHHGPYGNEPVYNGRAEFSKPLNHAVQGRHSEVPLPPSYMMQKYDVPVQGTASSAVGVAQSSPVAVSRVFQPSFSAPPAPSSRATAIPPPSVALATSPAGVAPAAASSSTARELCLLSLPNREAVAAAATTAGCGAYRIGAPPPPSTNPSFTTTSGRSGHKRVLLSPPPRNGSSSGVRFTLHVPPPLPRTERHTAADRMSSPPLLSISDGRLRGEGARRDQQRRALSVPPPVSQRSTTSGVLGGGILKSGGGMRCGTGLPPPLPLPPATSSSSAVKHAFFVPGADVSPNTHPSSTAAITLLSLHSPESKLHHANSGTSIHGVSPTTTTTTATTTTHRASGGVNDGGSLPSNGWAQLPYSSAPPSVAPPPAAGGSEQGERGGIPPPLPVSSPPPSASVPASPTPASACGTTQAGTSQIQASNGILMPPSSNAPPPTGTLGIPVSESTAATPPSTTGKVTTLSDAQSAYSAALAAFLEGSGPAPPPPAPASASMPSVTQSAKTIGAPLTPVPTAVGMPFGPIQPAAIHNNNAAGYVTPPVGGVSLAHPIPPLPSPGVSLTHSEEVDFQRYVKELLSRGQAAEVSRMPPMNATSLNSGAPPPTSATPFSHAFELGGGGNPFLESAATQNSAIHALCEQQKSFLQTTENFLRRRDEESDRLCRQLEATVTAIQQKCEFSPPTISPSVASSPAALLSGAPSPTLHGTAITTTTAPGGGGVPLIAPSPVSVLSPPAPVSYGSSLEVGVAPGWSPVPSPSAAVPVLGAPPLVPSNPPPAASIPGPQTPEKLPPTLAPAPPVVVPPLQQLSVDQRSPLESSTLQRQRDELLALNEKTLEKEIQEARARFAATSEALSSTLITTSGLATAAAAVPPPPPPPSSGARPIAVVDKAVSTVPEEKGVHHTIAVASTPCGVTPLSREVGSQVEPPLSPSLGKRDTSGPTRARASPPRNISRSPLPLRGSSEPRWRVPSGPPRDLQELYQRAAVSRPTNRAARAASHSRVAAPTASSKSRGGAQTVRRSPTPLEDHLHARTELSPRVVPAPAYTREDNPHPMFAWSPSPLQVHRENEEDQQLLNIPSHPQRNGSVYNSFVDRQVNRRKENILKRVALLNREFA